MSAPTADAQSRDEAIHWYVRLHSGMAGEEDQAAFQHWLQQAPGHQLAWTQLSGLRQMLQSVPAPIAAPALQALQLSRREALRKIGGVAALSAVALIGGRMLPWQRYTADYRTGSRQRGHFLLADGSELWLDAASVVDVDFSADQRHLYLHTGQLVLRSGHSHGEQRPLSVLTEHGEIHALGTRFGVALRDHQTEVTVLEDTVRVCSHGGSERLLHAGWQLRFDADQIHFTSAAGAHTDAWTAGLLVVHDRPLAEVLAELGRYHAGYLGCDPAIATIRVSGVYPLDDTAAALRLLTRRFPLQVTTVTRFWTWLGPA